MPALDSPSAAKPPKFMLIGHSGAGKTGALTSLVKAGHQLRIIDMDMGLDALTHHVKEECPDKLKNIHFMSFRDRTKAGPTGFGVAGSPKAFVGAVSALDKWDDGTTPADWPAGTILVLDSLTAMGRAAFAWAKAMSPSAKEPRQHFYAAQDAIENVIANLTDKEFPHAVIVISHIDLRTQPDGTTQGFPSSIGGALGPKLPRYFNTLVLLETTGMGATVKRTLRTFPTATVGSVKNANPRQIPPTLPIETGLASLFDLLKG